MGNDRMKSAKIGVKSENIEERCPKCGKMYIESLHCWPKMGKEREAICGNEEVTRGNLVMGKELMEASVVH